MPDAGIFTQVICLHAGPQTLRLTAFDESVQVVRTHKASPTYISNCGSWRRRTGYRRVHDDLFIRECPVVCAADYVTYACIIVPDITKEVAA